MPYDQGALRSIYHTREYCIRKLSLVSLSHTYIVQTVSHVLFLKLPHNRVFLSHDWPMHIERYGDKESLLRRKPHFRQEVEAGQFGSPPLMELLRTLRPEWWFAAHMHIRYEATVEHRATASPPAPPTQEPAGVATQPNMATAKTRFLGLDKCLPNRDFLEVGF